MNRSWLPAFLLLAPAMAACQGPKTCETQATCSPGLVCEEHVCKSTSNSFVAGFVRAFCDVKLRCEGWIDEETCEAFYQRDLGAPQFNNLGAVIAAVQAGKVAFDSQAAERCLAAVESQSCSVPLVTWRIPACQGVFTGQVPDGAACIADAECRAAGSSCHQQEADSRSCQGICGPKSPGFCLYDSDCPTGQSCDLATSTCQTTVPPGAQGQPCGTNGVCQDGLYCGKHLDSDPQPSCLPMAQAGQPCVYGDFSCADGMLCITPDEGTSNLCVVPKKLGESCQQSEECGGNISNFVCDLGSHTCIRQPVTGSCAGQTSRSCAPMDAYCDPSYQCHPFKQLGETCATWGECGMTSDVTCDHSPSNPSVTVCQTVGFCTP